MTISALVLAGGKGTRMNSSKAKVLHTLLGDSMLSLVHHTLRNVVDNIYTLIGHDANRVQASIAEDLRANCILQLEQLGTAHALLTALPKLQTDYILLVNADVPCVEADELKSFIQQAQNYKLSFMSLTLDNPANYGRVVRNNGQVAAIIEAKDYDEAKYGKASGEINTGVYFIELELAKRLLPLIENNNKSKEYYLTDLVALALNEGQEILAYQSKNLGLLGINDNLELVQMEEQLAKLQVKKHLENGVIIHNPSQVRISPLVKIEAGAEIYGAVSISGQSIIGKEVTIFENNIIKNCLIESGTTIHSFCHLEQAKVGKNCTVGPYGRLRFDSVMEDESHLGNFVEMKKTRLGKGAKANHLSYLGDAEIGEYSNIGAGTITCNYDGKNKHKTIIGKNSFIGSNTALIAPISLGENCLIGAGSTLSKDVPDDTLALTRAPVKMLAKRQE